MKRTFDVFFATLGLALLSPIFFFIAIFIITEDGFPVFFRQKRVGLRGKPFRIHKFRSMFKESEKSGLQITVGSKDSRITRVGYYLRKTKLDELPQLIDVICGTMSIVGPRPEVPTYTRYYTPEQLIVLSIRPGITDFASIAYRNENDLLAVSEDPELTYIHEIMPRKIELNLEYIRNQSIWMDIKLILYTLSALIRNRNPWLPPSVKE